MQERKLTSKGALAINQEICAALSVALSSYKKVKLDVSIKRHIEAALPVGCYHVSVYQNDRFSKGYNIRVTPKCDYSLSRGVNLREIGFNDSKDKYAIEFNDDIETATWSGDPVDWRAKWEYVVNRFNHLDYYEWERITETVRGKIEALNTKAIDLRKKAEALIAALPRPEHDTLNRQGKHVPYDIQKLYPALFGKD